VQLAEKRRFGARQARKEKHASEGLASGGRGERKRHTYTLTGYVANEPALLDTHAPDERRTEPAVPWGAGWGGWWWWWEEDL